MNKFKKGDLVRITGNDINHKFTIGETVRIVEKGANTFKCEHLDRHGWWWVPEKNLELIPTCETQDIPWEVPDWFTWGKLHKCWVWDYEGENKDISYIYSVDATKYRFCGITTPDAETYPVSYNYAEPIIEPSTPDPLSDLLKDLDFGCQQDNVRKLVENIITEIKGEKNE